MTTSTPTRTGPIPDDIEFESPKAKTFDLRVGPGPYIGRFSRIEKAPPGQYGPQLYSWWELHNTVEEDGKTKVIPAQLNEDGSIFEWRQKTSNKFGKNPKSGKTAALRANAEALLKRDIEDDEDTRAVINEALGKAAMLYLVSKQGSDGNMYLELGTIEPYRKGMVAPVQRFEEESADDELPFDGGAPAKADDDEAPF